LSLRNGYHGLVGNAGNITNVGTWNSPMRGGFEFEKLAWPSTYRGSNLTTAELIEDAKETLNANTSGKVSGFIFECIQGVGGINPLPEGYLPQMIDLVRNKHGGLIICDEVQTGFGRVGTKYWGHKWQGIKPDIITMAKGIGNGFPIGAVVTRKEITDRVKQVFFNTFGGGHIQCRVGLEVLNVIRKEKLDENAEIVGNYLLAELTKLSQKHRLIGDVRGKGLMIGMELVKDKVTKEPAKDEANQLMELTRERGLLFGKGGALGNVLRIQPPLCLSLQDAKYIVDAVDDSLLQIK
jgi:alanine-glyoxylate transaminase/(R)-3-amino-2-methylpropionate-pyruvate transaminase